MIEIIPKQVTKPHLVIEFNKEFGESANKYTLYFSVDKADIVENIYKQFINFSHVGRYIRHLVITNEMMTSLGFMVKSDEDIYANAETFLESQNIFNSVVVPRYVGLVYINEIGNRYQCRVIP